MSSVLPGYAYDVFISYRQKDNKADKWVTHFVETLKDEIDATFKEDIAVYFDENPHDGLLETHDVDQSLQEKIKVLVFIPIISQTYCDPNSFAWQKEFIAFRDFAKQDELGLDIRLTNGNVCKRILPVRIHEIAAADQALYEKEADGVMRPVDFIYKAPGVNRPLTAEEDNPHANLNSTFYRDQINKVANAIKEVIGGIKGDESPVIIRQVTEFTEAKTQPSAIINLGSKILWTILFLVVISGFAYLYFDRNTLIPSGIAVLTFSNFSDDEDNQYFAAGITEAVRINIGQAPDLKVISRNSIEKFESLGLSTPEIAGKLGVQYILEGSIQREGNNIRINVQLFDAMTDTQIWSNAYDKPYANLLTMQNNIAIDIVSKLNLSTGLNHNESIQELDNPEVYNLYLKGLAMIQRSTGARDELKTNLQLFDSVIVMEPGFAPAYLGKAQAYLTDMFFSRSNISEIKGVTIDLIMKAMELDNGISECYSSLGIIYYHDLEFNLAEQYFKKALSLNPNNSEAYKWFAILSFITDDFENFNNFYDQAISLDPMNIGLQADKLIISHMLSDLGEEETLKLLIEETGDDFATFCLGILQANDNNFKAAMNTMQNRKVAGAQTNWLLGYAYGKNGNRNKAINSLNFNLNRRNETYVPAYFICIIYMGLNEYEKALDWLELEYEEGPSYVFIYGLKIDPKLSPLEGHPRFEKLLAKMPFDRIR